MVKATDEQAHEEINDVKSGRVLSAEAFVPMELGHTILLETLWTYTFGNFMGFHYTDIIFNQLHFQPSVFSRECGHGSENFKL